MIGFLLVIRTGGFIMFILSSIILIISLFLFFLAYANLSDKNNKFDKITMWIWNYNKYSIKDEESYKKFQGKSSLVFAILFIITSILILLEGFNYVNRWLLNLCIVIITVAVLVCSSKGKEHFKKNR